MKAQPTLAVVATGVLLAAAMEPLAAQPEDARPADTLFFVANSAAVMPFDGAVDVIGRAGSVPGELVTGKPYSAESITESIQMLADGNRIVRTNRARIYRDSEGRTRREQTLDAIGVWETGAEPMTMITINDPVAQMSYVVDATTETVRRLPPFRLEMRHDTSAQQSGEVAAGVAAGGEIVTRTIVLGPGPEAGGTPDVVPFDAPLIGPHGEPGGPHLVAMPPGTFNVPINVTTSWSTAPIAATTEDLGEQVLQGVLARGVRQTQTIPAGAIGNERPIEIVSEQWYSEELEAVVLRTSKDPRFGETSYRLVNVDRSEPPPELFAPPQDYEAIDVGAPPRVGLGVPGRRIAPPR